MARIGQMSAQTGQVIAARQSQHLTETMADLTALIRDVAPKTNDPSAATRAYTDFVQSIVRRNSSLFSFYAETLASMAQQVMTVPQTPPSTHAHGHDTAHSPAPKSNGRAVPANS